MSRFFCYQESLEYTAPSHGDWGLVRILTQIPEAYVLFICPPACGRHSALGAVHQKIKDKVSYYFLDEKEITKGYDEEIKTACRELLKIIKKKPRVLFTVVSCLDDLIGTDIDTVTKELREEYPSIRFLAGHMNPITMDSDSPPLITNLKLMFSLLDKPKIKDRGVNLLGPFVKVRKESELYQFFEKVGCSPIRHLSDFNSFDKFQTMAQSQCNILLAPIAAGIGKLLNECLDIPFLSLFTSYDLKEIAEQYQQLKKFFNISSDCNLNFISEREEQAKQKILETLKICDEKPIYIAQGSVFKPFQLAFSLRSYGFNVRAVIAQKILPIEKKYMEALSEDKNIQFIQTQHYKTILFEHTDKNAIGIGFDAAYIAQSNYVVSLMNDEECFGYDGVIHLMDLIQDAIKNPKNLENLIRDYGLVI